MLDFNHIFIINYYKIYRGNLAKLLFDTEITKPKNLNLKFFRADCLNLKS